MELWNFYHFAEHKNVLYHVLIVQKFLTIQLSPLTFSIDSNEINLMASYEPVFRWINALNLDFLKNWADVNTTN